MNIVLYKLFDIYLKVFNNKKYVGWPKRSTKLAHFLVGFWDPRPFGAYAHFPVGGHTACEIAFAQKELAKFLSFFAIHFFELEEPELETIRLIVLKIGYLIENRISKRTTFLNLKIFDNNLNHTRKTINFEAI